MKLKPIHQQVVVVVGANSGIGRETALRFAERGAKVLVSGRSLAPLTELVNEIQSKGGEAAAQVADVTQFEQMQALAEWAHRYLGAFGGRLRLCPISGNQARGIPAGDRGQHDRASVWGIGGSASPKANKRSSYSHWFRRIEVQLPFA